MLRYRVTSADGRRVENIATIGLVREFPKDKDAWREVDRLGLGVRINDAPTSGRASFHFLAEHYLKADFGADAVRPKSANTIPIVEHYVRDYLVKRFGEQIAEDIKPLEIQKWLKSLNEVNGLAWTTIAKMRGLMHRIYKVGILHEHVAKNPVLHVETRSKSAYRAIIITPAQTVAILKSLPSPLHYTLVLTCAATALRSSEILTLRWSDVLWGEGRGRRNKNRCVGRLRPATSGLSRPSSRVATPDAACKGNRLYVSVVESHWKETAQLFCIRRRPSATGRKESRSTHRGRPAVRTSQFASQLKQLAGEQGESRTENRTGNPASRKDSDNARSVHAGRQR